MKRSLVVCVALIAAGACLPEEILVATRQAASSSVASTSTAASGSGGAGGVGGAGGSGGSAEVASGTGGAGGEAPTTCYDNDDCQLDQYCGKSKCTSAQGICKPRPSSCDATFQPVCGCNGITYYNDCLRRQYGATVRDYGECFFTATTCAGSSNKQCIGDAWCGRLFPPGGFCPSQFPGKCWILPSVCPEPAPPGDRFKPCQGAGACLDTCAAIRTELPYTKTSNCGKP
jgi:hypothetical protein